MLSGGARAEEGRFKLGRGQEMPIVAVAVTEDRTPAGPLAESFSWTPGMISPAPPPPPGPRTGVSQAPFAL